MEKNWTVCQYLIDVAIVYSHRYQHQANNFMLGNRYLVNAKSHFVLTICELISKEKAMSLVWNYFGFEAGEDGKMINSENVMCRIVSVSRRKPILVRGRNT